MVLKIHQLPHLLMAGTTGAGKSVCLSVIISSLIARNTPQAMRLLLIDPKYLEFSLFGNCPHLLTPVITNPEKACAALTWCVCEMERRYAILQKGKAKDLQQFNKSADKDAALPYLVVVIDELADLMLTGAKSIEQNIQRLAQKARACGIHLILATQRPSVDVLTGVIKANLPARIAFQVTSRHDSRTILDTYGAERLLGKGDLLVQIPGKKALERVQSYFIEDHTLEQIVATARRNYPLDYNPAAVEWIEKAIPEATKDPSNDRDDEFLDQAIALAKERGKISASFIQRKLRLGYNRAARIVETMEEQKLISGPDHQKQRHWL